MTGRLDVFYDNRSVGIIERVGDAPEALTFTYSQDWQAGTGAFPLSTRMPLRAQPYPPEETYVWLLNLLPEGNDLPLVGRNLGVSHVDVFALLERMGRDVAGAVEIAPPATAVPARPRYHRLDEAALADTIRRLPERPLLAGDEGVQMSLAGNQSKLPVAKVKGGGLALPLDGAPSTHILKPAIKGLHGSTENEYFCLSLAAATGLNAARCDVGLAEHEPYLLVRRYDRERVDGRIVRLHQEDFCQACGKPPYLKYEADRGYGRGPGITDLFAVVDEHSTDRARDRLALRDAVIFNLLIDNVDAHAKNFSLLIAPGAVRLAPLYDLMSGAIYAGVTANMAMRIAGKSRGAHIHGRHWDRLAKAVGFSPLSLRKRVAELADVLPNKAAELATRLKEGSLDGFVFDQIAEAVKERCSRVLANLKSEGPRNGEEEEAITSSGHAPRMDMS